MEKIKYKLRNGDELNDPEWQRIQTALNDGSFDKDFTDSFGVTILMHAIQNGKTELALLLLEKGANPNSQDTKETGRTPLMIAALKGDQIITKALLEKGAEINTRDNNRYTALMYASYNPKGENVVKTLLESPEIEIDAVNSRDESALTRAVSNGSPKSARMLLKKGANCSATGVHLLKIIFKHPERIESNKDIIELVLKDGGVNPEDKSKALLEVCGSSNFYSRPDYLPRIAKILISNDCDLPQSCQNKYAIKNAIKIYREYKKEMSRTLEEIDGVLPSHLSDHVPGIIEIVKKYAVPDIKITHKNLENHLKNYLRQEAMLNKDNNRSGGCNIS